MKKDVYVVYESDQWLTKSEHAVKAVCDNWDSVMLVAEDIMKEYGVKYEEDLDEDDEETESIEQALEEFGNASQYRGHDFGICVEMFVLNDKPYDL